MNHTQRERGAHLCSLHGFEKVRGGRSEGFCNRCHDGVHDSTHCCWIQAAHGCRLLQRLHDRAQAGLTAPTDDTRYLAKAFVCYKER